MHPGDDVHLVLISDGLKRLADVALQRGAREELIDRTAVDQVLALTWLKNYASNCPLALTGGCVARVGSELDCRGDRYRNNRAVRTDSAFPEPRL